MATTSPEPTAALRRPILGVRFDLIGFDAAVARLAAWIRRDHRGYVTFTNPRVVMLARRDPGLRAALGRAGLVLPDGIGIVWAARLLGYRCGGRVDGPTFMLELCGRGRELGWRHFFYGGRPGVAPALADALTARHPGLSVAGTRSPPFRPLSRQEDEAVVAELNRAGPDILWVGLGAPKQEKWMAAHCGRVRAAAMIGVGAAFDFHSGRLRRAPRWARDRGLEWLWRFFEHPRREIGRKALDAEFLLRALATVARRRAGRLRAAEAAEASR